MNLSKTWNTKSEAGIFLVNWKLVQAVCIYYLLEFPVYKTFMIHQSNLAKMHHCVAEEKQINIHCRSKCEETSDNSNCCAFLQYKADNTSLQIQKLDASGRNVYKFNYRNDSLL